MAEYIQDRDINLESLQPRSGFDGLKWPKDNKNASVRRAMPTGWVPGQEMHHIITVDQASMYVQGRTYNEASAIVNAFQENGIRIGNDGRNIVSLDELLEHQYNVNRPNNAHTALGHLGLDEKVMKDDDPVMNLSRNQNFKNRIVNTPTDVLIKDVIPVFAEFIGGPSQEIAQKLNPAVPGREENIRYYKEVEVPAEREQELRLYEAEVNEARRTQQDKIYDQLARTDSSKPASVSKKTDQLISDIKSDGLLSSMVQGAKVNHKSTGAAKQRARAYTKQRKSEGQQTMNLTADKHMPTPRTNSVSSARSKAKVWSLPQGAVIQF